MTDKSIDWCSCLEGNTPERGEMCASKRVEPIPGKETVYNTPCPRKEACGGRKTVFIEESRLRP